MSKKRKNPAPAAAEPEVSAEELGQARELIAGLGADCSTGAAKKLLVQRFEWRRALANAVVVRLREEGFMAGEGDSGWFVSPDAATAVGVVQGARSNAMMTLAPQSDAGEPIPISQRSWVVPGDVVEMRATVNGWRVGRPLSRPQKRWVCRSASGRRDALQLFRPVSSFAPVLLAVPGAELPADWDPERDVVELELDAEAPFTCSAGSGRGEYGWRPPENDPNEFPAHFVRVVGLRNDPLGEMAIASAQFGVPIDFSPETLEEADALPDRVDRRSLAHRVDLTDLPFVTIDGEDARDFDDAVYCAETEEGWRLLVAIADVSHYVRPGSALDRDAQIRATSVYFPASVVPMLPEKLSNGLCSLNPGVDRLTLVCDALVNREGETTAYQFYPAVIHSHGRLTYTAVWSALSDEPAGLEAVGERIDDLRRLHALFGALRAARERRLALDFETQESAADFNEAGEITGFHVREHNDAHRIIEECMLVANVCAAEFAIAKKRTTLFRVHGEPEQSRLSDLAALLKTFGVPFRVSEKVPLAAALSQAIAATKDRPYIQTAILRTMQRACYQPDNIGHFGLQYKAYAHFTSPIRRYPDLLLHRTIKGILSRRTYTPAVAFDDAELMTGYHARKLGARPEERPAAATKPAGRAEAQKAVWTRMGIICSAAERRADDASRDVMKFLKCSFLLKQRGRTFDGVVCGMCPAGVFVELERMPVEGFIHISQLGWGYFEYDAAAQRMTSHEEMSEVRLGDRVRVALESVELEERRINFRLDTNYARHRVRGRGRSRRSGDFDDGMF